MFRILLLLSLLFVRLHCSAQVLNIESLRFQNDSDGWIGTVKFAFAAQQNVNRIYDFGNSIHAQYRKGQSRWILLNNLVFSKTNGKSFENTGYEHIRYDYKLKKYDWLTWEAFVQTQYNKPMKMDLRAIAGTGPRFRLIKKERAHMYLGTLYMFEHEEDEGEVLEAIYNDHRLDSYLTFTWAPVKNAEMVNTVYYQPAFTDFSDYRISEVFSFAFTMTKHFAFETGFNLTYDTKQPPGIPNLYWSLEQGLNFNF
jgi:putative salt-induced outer membrane protein YdiY